MVTIIRLQLKQQSKQVVRKTLFCSKENHNICLEFGVIYYTIHEFLLIRGICFSKNECVHSERADFALRVAKSNLKDGSCGESGMVQHTSGKLRARVKTEISLFIVA